MKLFKNNYFKIGFSVFLLYVCIRMWPSVENVFSAIIGAAAPLFIGFAIAYIVNIPMSFFERHYFPNSKNKFAVKSRTPVCLTLAFLAIIAIFTVICILVFPQLVSCIKIVITKLPASIDELIAWAKGLEILPESFIASLDEIDWMEKISYYAQILISGIGNIAQTVVNVVFSVFSLLVTAFLATIFAIYLLLGKRGLTKNAIYLGKRFIKKDHHSKVAHVLRVANKSFHQYIVGQCTEAVILGSLCALGMLILRLPYVAMISSLIAFTALIPIAGAFIGGGVGAVMIFTVSPIKALIFLIFLLILQQLENNIIFPKVVGTSLGMPSIWVLAAVTVGGGLAGVIGMILSVPLAATAYKLIGEYMEKCRKADEAKLAVQVESSASEEKNENIEEKNEDSGKN